MKVAFTVLDSPGIERIHESAKRVISTAGMMVHDHDLCSTLSRLGLAVDQHQRLVWFPAEAVEEALVAAPRSFSMSDHRGNPILLKSGNPLPAVYSNAIKVWDWETKGLRPSTLDDLARCVRLADALPEVKVMCPVCLPSDVAQETQMARAIHEVLSQSRKMTMAAPQDGTEARFWTEATAVADQDLPMDSDPSLMFVVSPTSPLQIDSETCQVLKHGVESGVPLLISSCPMAGATSPITMAGTTVQTHAEFLGMLTIAQLLREGAPVIYGGSAGPMDLRVGTLSYGAAERHTMLCANIDIADHFGLPHFSSAGTVDSALPDFQTGQAKALSWVTRLMKGTILGIWFGSLLTGQAVAAEQILLDADTYHSVLSMLAGMDLQDERLAIDAICRVGPGGSFLMDHHTLAWMRSGEYYASPVVNHEGPEGPSMVERAHEHVQEILASHQSSVSDSVAAELAALLEEHKAHLRR
jgi:trimethylamine--corrinoid protein Co-methyltransferase